jgi:hypothetical protein
MRYPTRGPEGITLGEGLTKGTVYPAAKAGDVVSGVLRALFLCLVAALMAPRADAGVTTNGKDLGSTKKAEKPMAGEDKPEIPAIWTVWRLVHHRWVPVPCGWIGGTV